MRTQLAMWMAALLTISCTPSNKSPADAAAGRDAAVNAGSEPGKLDAHGPPPLRQRLGFSGVGWLDGRRPENNQRFFGSMGYADADAYGVDVVRHMRSLSATMARAEFHYKGEGVFVAVPKSLHRRMRDEAFELYGWINPIPPVESLDDQYEQGLRQLVQSNPHIKHWQIGNEPDLLWQNKDEFFSFFIRSQRVIRERCPDCKILLAGISGQYDTSSERHLFYDRLLRRIAAAKLPGCPFDIFDFHYYKARPSAAEISRAVGAHRDQLARHGLATGVVFWCTETGLYTGDPPGPKMALRTEEQQAIDLSRLAAWMLAAGVQRVFYWTVVETWGGMGIPGFFDNMGLVYNGLGGETERGVSAGTKKLAYHTFGLLSAGLARTTGAARISPGVYRFEAADGPRFIVWDEGFSTVSLTGIAASKVLVRQLVRPPGGAKDRTLPVVRGAVRIGVDQRPKLVTSM